MAIQEIRYGGMTAQPSDYENKDGELAVAVNLLNEEGHLSPLLPAEVVKELPEGTKGCWVHRTSEYMHYILWGDYEVFPGAPVVENALLWIDSADMETIHDMEHSYAGITKVVPLGNTLCILHEGGMVYLLWKEDEYKELSPNLPEIKLSFGLQCEWKLDYWQADRTSEETFTNSVIGALNKFLKKEGDGKGKFAMPFVLRYAYRMFDGSYIMQSAPIAMIPISSQSYMQAGTTNGWIIHPFCELDMMHMGLPDNILDYFDIIESVDIFVSAPIYTYNQDGRIPLSGSESIIEFQEAFDNNYGIYKIKSTNNTPYDWSDIAPEYSCYASLHAFTIQTGCGLGYNTLDNNFTVYPQYFIRLPEPINSLNESIKDCSTFYHIQSILLKDISSYETRTILDISRSKLLTLTSQPTLTDDYDSHEEMSAKIIHSYNQRLMLGGINKKLINGYFNIPHVESGHTIDIDYGEEQVDVQNIPNFPVSQIVVDLKIDNKEYRVIENLETPIQLPYRIHPIETIMGSDLSYYTTYYWLPLYFYYPKASAYKVRFLTQNFHFTNNVTIEGVPYPDGGYFYYKLTFDLRSHPLLNGAYHVDRTWKQVDIGIKTTDTPPYIPSTDLTYRNVNKLYTSEVLNPWYFPVEGVVTVGNAELTALSAATQALSQGQFGEFPLYAFCTDGVWALTVGQTGYFTRSVPVSRDVCTNPDSVLQIDDAVIYPTDRGLMLLAGSKNVCFTEPMNNREGKDYESQLPGMRELRALAGLSAQSTNATVATRQHRCLNPAPLREFLQDCKMLYDYVGQKIVVYNPKIETYSNGQISLMYRKYKYALVYSLKTNLWGMTETDLQLTVNSYPEAMGMTDAKKLVRFSAPTPALTVEGGGSVTGLFITRPLKLGAPDVLKTVRTVMQRGMFRRGDVKSVLWGSRDLYNWYLIHSSQDEGLHNMSGTPYKYFIIGGLVTLTEGKSVSGASVEAEAKMTDVLR